MAAGLIGSLSKLCRTKEASFCVQSALRHAPSDVRKILIDEILIMEPRLLEEVLIHDCGCAYWSFYVMGRLTDRRVFPLR